MTIEAPKRKRIGRFRRGLLGWNHRIAKLMRLTHGRLLPRTPTLLIASTPKSGSTFLVSCLREATGFPAQFLGNHFMSEQDLAEPRLLDALPVPVVVHQHFAANKATVDLLRRYDLPVLFQFRRLDDTLASMRDKLEGDGWLDTTYHAGPDVLGLPESARTDLALQLFAPRFLRIYASWWTALETGRLSGQMLSYEAMVDDKPKALRETMKTFGLALSQARAEAVVAAVEARGDTRFNKGMPGRGKYLIEDRHMPFIEGLIAPYPWVDFRPVGLRGPEPDARPLTTDLGESRV